MTLPQHDSRTLEYIKKFRSAINVLFYEIRGYPEFDHMGHADLFAHAALTAWKANFKDQFPDKGIPDDFDPDRFKYAARAHYLGLQIQYPPFN